jgi:hypothetical protein
MERKTKVEESRVTPTVRGISQQHPIQGHISKAQSQKLFSIPWEFRPEM